MAKAKNQTPSSNTDEQNLPIYDAAQDIEDLQQQLATVQKENIALKQSAAKTGQATKAIVPKESFSCIRKGETEAKSYVFVVAKFRIQGQELTATDALTDEAVLQRLVDSGSGLIKIK